MDKAIYGNEKWCWKEELEVTFSLYLQGNWDFSPTTTWKWILTTTWMREVDSFPELLYKFLVRLIP